MKIGHGEGGTNGTISLQRCQQCLVSDAESIPSACKFQRPLVTIALRDVSAKLKTFSRKEERDLESGRLDRHGALTGRR